MLCHSKPSNVSEIHCDRFFDIRTFKIGMPVGLAETPVMIDKSVSMKQAIETAKGYIMADISHPLNIGHGPTNHWAYHDKD